VISPWIEHNPSFLAFSLQALTQLLDLTAIGDRAPDPFRSEYPAYGQSNWPFGIGTLSLVDAGPQVTPVSIRSSL
jgi:hypothetical protein